MFLAAHQQSYDKMYRMASATNRRRLARELLTALGTAIVSGEYTPGQVLTLEG